MRSESSNLIKIDNIINPYISFQLQGIMRLKILVTII